MPGGGGRPTPTPVPGRYQPGNQEKQHEPVLYMRQTIGIEQVLGSVRAVGLADPESQLPTLAEPGPPFPAKRGRK